MSSSPLAESGGGSFAGRRLASLWPGIGIAIAATAAAVLASLVLEVQLANARLGMFYGAVLVSAWLGGRVAGIVAIVLSVVATETIVAGSARALPFAGGSSVGTIVFVGIAYAIVHVVISARGSAPARSEDGRLRAKTEDAERVARRTRRLQATTAALLRTITPQQVGRVIMEQGLGAVEADVALLAMVSGDGQTVRVTAARGYPSDARGRARVTPLDSPESIPVAIRTGEPVWAPRGSGLLPLAPAAAAGDGARFNGTASDQAWAVLPLVGRDRTLGAMALGFDRDVAFSEEEKTLLELLAQECAQALERARLYEAERNARVKAEFAERQITFLSEASKRLASSLNYMATLESVARLAVPEFADWCTVHVCGSDGGLQLIAAEHADARKAEVLHAIGRKFPARAAAPMGPGRVQQTREPELIREITRPMLEAGAWDVEHLALLHALGPRSEICVPMIARDRVLGMITLVVAESGRRYTPADLALAEQLASRAAQAIENARLYEDTRAASQAKSDFLAVMSHELRTPLNAILGYADLVLMGVSGAANERTHDYVERVRVAAQDLLRLVEEVLSFARLEAGRESLRVEIVDVQAAAREAVALIEAPASQKGIRIACEMPDRVVELETDGWKLRQILGNLLSNAVKFTAEGMIHVGVSNDGSSVSIAVRDTGIGIAADHIDHIFDPFWQVEQTSTRRFGGVGIGLGVARELTNLLGGRLSAESQPGSGSTFTLRLPLRPLRETPLDA